MKRYFIYLLIVFVFAAACFGMMCLRDNRVKMEFATEAKVCFQYGDVNVLQNLDDEELAIIKGIFDGKKLYKDNPSCGFSESILIKFNEYQTFCIARDTCPIVYILEADRYLKLTEEEKTRLYNVLEAHGVFLPCV